jgi:hypothetical protein
MNREVEWAARPRFRRNWDMGFSFRHHPCLRQCDGSCKEVKSVKLTHLSGVEVKGEKNFKITSLVWRHA